MGQQLKVFKLTVKLPVWLLRSDLPPSPTVFPSPEGLTDKECKAPNSQVSCCLPASECRLVQIDDSHIHLFSAQLLGLLGHGTTFACRDLTCVKIHAWCLLPSAFQQLPHHVLLCSRADLSLYSAAHFTYLRQTRSSHLSAAHSHYGMHVLYSTYPGGRSPVGFLSLFAQFDELLILFDLENSHSNKIHTVPPAPSQDREHPTEASGGNERFWLISTVQSHDKNCFTQWSDFRHKEPFKEALLKCKILRTSW